MLAQTLILLGLVTAHGLLIEYPMNIEKAPFMASVGNCDAAVVSRQFVLVSAKCLCLGERPTIVYTGTSWNNVRQLPKEGQYSPFKFYNYMTLFAAKLRSMIFKR